MIYYEFDFGGLREPLKSWYSLETCRCMVWS